MIIKDIELYNIFNSCGKKCIEVKMISSTGTCSYASTPTALIAGRREAFDTEEINKEAIEKMIFEVLNHDLEQNELDSILKKYLYIIGTGICLGISLAFARIYARENNITLVNYLKKLISSPLKFVKTIPMVTIFSGGVHKNNDFSIQNIMVCAEEKSFYESLLTTTKIFGEIEKFLESKNLLVGYGQSSGMIVQGLTTTEKIELISTTLKKQKNCEKVSIAVDVAAEHLWRKDKKKYCLDNKFITGNDLMITLNHFIKEYPISFVEDPFEPSEEIIWQKFFKLNSKICVAGDDIFATQAKYLNSDIANGVIIKMNQAGTLTDTLTTVERAKELGMKLCVSHRSIETDDTFMCDLAIAIGANYIKIGGPRRGERIEKYNRMIRLERGIDYDHSNIWL